MKQLFMAGIFCLLFLPAFYKVNAQECRDLTDKEKQAYDKLVTVLNENLAAKLQGDDWEIKSNTTSDHISAAKSPGPARPLMFCQRLYDASFQLNPSSAQYTKLSDSANFYMEQSSKATDPNESLRLIKKYSSCMQRSTFRIGVAENVPDYYLQEPGSGELIDHYTVLSVPGAMLALQIWYQGVEKGDEPIQQTVLCFGKWKNNLVKNSTARWYFHFAFQHPIGTPFIENVVVTIHTDAARANDIIKKIDWTKINDGLTQ